VNNFQPLFLSTVSVDKKVARARLLAVPATRQGLRIF